MGATTVILYGVNLLWNPVLTPYMEDPDNPGLTMVKHPYHVRVLVPCYSESLDIIRRTIMAAYDAILPEVIPHHYPPLPLSRQCCRSYSVCLHTRLHLSLPISSCTLTPHRHLSIFSSLRLCHNPKCVVATHSAIW